MKVEYDENMKGYYISEDGVRVSNHYKKEEDANNLLDAIIQLAEASLHEGEKD